MAYLSHVGSFNIDPDVTVGNTQSVTDVGFQPKIVLFWWSGSTATGDEVAGGTINIGFGAAIDSTHRFCVIMNSDDAEGTSDTNCYQSSGEVIRCYTDATTPTLDGLADFSAMTANGFDIIIDDQFTQAYRISYLALGGDDLTNVYIGSKQMANVTGEYNVDGVGFQPDAVITSMASSLNESGAPVSPSGYFEIGMATSNSNQGVIAIYSQHNQTTSNTTGYGYNGEFLSRSGLSTVMRHSFVSFGADGFTLNKLESTIQNYFFFIALKGGQYSVGNILTHTDGNDIAETVGFQPATLLFASANRALSTQDTVTAHARMSIGAATSTTNRAAQAISDEDNLADTETAHANYDSAVYAHVIDDDTAGIMDLKSVESDGFTCVMDEVDASACWVTYLAIGATGGEPCVDTITATETVVDWC